MFLETFKKEAARAALDTLTTRRFSSPLDELGRLATLIDVRDALTDLLP